MQKIPFLLLIVLLLSAPALAYQQDFQNYGDSNDMSVYGAYPVSIINISGYPELFVAHIGTSGGGWTEIFYGQAQAATNWSSVMRGAGTTVPEFKFWDSSMALLGGWTGTNPTDLLSTTTPVRYDFRYNTANQIVIYKNGINRDLIAGIITAPRYFSAGGTGNSYIQVDDYTENPAPDAEFNYAEAIPIGYYVIIDAINPANNGLYFPNGTIIRSNTYYQAYSTLSNATKTWQVVNFQTGTAYETLKITGSTGIVGANISSLIGAPPGLYRTYIQDTGSSSTFWVVGYGATIAWDKDQYATDESSSIAWTILPAYYDTTNYNYNGNIIDSYGTTKKSWTISSSTGSESTTLDSTTYPQGTYFATVTKTQKASPYNVTTMIYDYAEIITDVIVKGGIYNTTGTSLPGTHINITQSGITSQHTASPLYNQTGNTPSVEISINATHPAGWYQSDNITFTPPSWGTYNINFYLLPTVGNMTYTGNASIYGLVREDALLQPIPSAMVNIQNATYLSNTTSNATGFYQFNGLAKNEFYTLWATKTGYNQSANYNVNSTHLEGTTVYNVTRQDIEMEQQYQLRVDLKDATSLAYITDPLAVTITEGINTQTSTTSTGYANFTTRFALYSITATGTGYYSSSTTAVIDSDRVITLYLSKVVDTSNSNLNLLYPKEVRFIIVDRFGNRQGGVNVTAVMLSSTTDSTNWLSTLFGISSYATPINSTTMYGTTDEFGSVVFPMIGSGRYQLDITKASVGISETHIISPDQTSYSIVVSTTASAELESKSDDIKLNLSVIDAGADLYLVGVYNDTSLTTIDITYWINQTNTTPYFSVHITGQNTTFWHIINNTRGTSYKWGLNTISTKWGYSNISEGITLKGLGGMMVNPWDASRTGWD